MTSFVSRTGTLPNGHLVVAGDFNAVAGVTVNKIARWDGTNWSSFGNGLSSQSGRYVNDLVIMPNGDFVAVGLFRVQSGDVANGVARWDGSQWSAVGDPRGSSVGFGVKSVLALPNGEILAGGEGGVFTSSSPIARWNGSNWSSVGSGFGPYPGHGFPAIRCMALLPNGDVVAAGFFREAGGVTAHNIARWDGQQWSAMGLGIGQDDIIISSEVHALAVMPNGDLIAGGTFTVAGNVAASNVARWNGTEWSAMGGGTGNTVRSLHVTPDGDLIAIGAFLTADFNDARYVARWDGNQWLAVGESSSQLSSDSLTDVVMLPGGLLVVGGARYDSMGQLTSPLWQLSGCVVCCAPDGSCTLVQAGASTAACPGGTIKADFAGAGCEPNPCEVVMNEFCCRGTTCNSVSVGTCTGTVAGSASLVVGSCGAGSAMATCCFADFNHDGSPSIDDLFLYLNAYFTGSPWANVGGDGVAAPTIDDLFLYINAYFTGCV